MFNRRQNFLVVLILLATSQLTGTARGDLVITSTPGITHEASSLSSFGTTAADMVGLEVMVYFADGTTDLGIWTTTGVSQNNWSLTIAPGQSTFLSPFDLVNNTGQAITRFSLNGAGSTTIFDRSILPGTPTSGNGRDLQEFTILRFFQDITVTYFDQVRLGTAPPAGDLFAGLDVQFSDGIAGGGGLFRFRTDTDTAFDTVTATIPEPSALSQFGFAVVVILLGRRRRKNTGAWVVQMPTKPTNDPLRFAAATATANLKIVSPKTNN